MTRTPSRPHQERAELYSGNGKLAWLVRPSRMGLAFGRVESQTRAQDRDLCIIDMLMFNKIVTGAKTDNTDITFWPIDLQKGALLAFGGPSFATVGENRTSSHTGLFLMYAEDKEAVLRGEKVRVSSLRWRSHRIKRVVRSTLVAETMTAFEVVENADVVRGHLDEIFGGIDYLTYYDGIRKIDLIHRTVCKSLDDLVHGRGTVPSKRRLLIDIEALRNVVENNSVMFKWINAKQMLADCLTKNDVRVADYLRHVLRTGVYQIAEYHLTDRVIFDERQRLKEKKANHDRDKYPKRWRPAEQNCTKGGHTYFNDVTAETTYKAKTFRTPSRFSLA